MTVGLALTVVALAIAGRRLWWLKRLALTGQPAPERIGAAREHLGTDLAAQAVEVIGQRKLLKWTVPGVAHALTFWGFIVLLLTIIEGSGDLFRRPFALPGIGAAPLLLYRGAQVNTGVFPYAHGAFASQIVGRWLAPLGAGVNGVLEVVF